MRHHPGRVETTRLLLSVTPDPTRDTAAATPAVLLNKTLFLIVGSTGTPRYTAHHAVRTRTACRGQTTCDAQPVDRGSFRCHIPNHATLTLCISVVGFAAGLDTDQLAAYIRTYRGLFLLMKTV